MKLLILLLVPVALCFFGTACDSTSVGNKRYEYPVSRLSTPKKVKAISTDGRFVILSDGSNWNIDWADAPRARRWQSGDRVDVIAVRGKPFPYTLVKQATGERLAARYGKKI